MGFGIGSARVGDGFGRGGTIQRVDRTVFSQQTLTNVVGTLDNFRLLSDKAALMAEHVGRLIDTNGPAISGSVSNLARFSEDLDKLMSKALTDYDEEFKDTIK